MFPMLRAFAEPSAALEAALLDIGKPGGILDAKDNLAAGPVALIVDPALNLNNPNNPTHTAGVTFMGQFFDHDITFDVGSTLGVPTDPKTARNGRTPTLDLDSVYGAGPIESPHLYDPTDRAKLRIESGGMFEDLPRAADMSAIIADPRNDEHVIIAGLQCAFIMFHNRAVDTVRGSGRRRAGDFAQARGLTTWDRVDAVREMATLVVVTRPDGDEVTDDSVEPLPGWRWAEVETPRLEVSSTDLRARVVDGRPLDYLLTPPVLDCIERLGLYRDDP